jgi:phage terminase Nu1 subunit (DNA packaging protein)
MGADTLVGAKSIAAALGISERRVAVLHAAGAPIKANGSGRGVRYLASHAALVHWLRCGMHLSPSVAI